MAKKDRKKWLKLFYSRWGYEPASAIRKKREYVKKIPLEEALMIATEKDYPFLVQVIFPFESRFPVSKKSSDSVTVFPQALYYDKESLYEIDEPILYDGIFYSLNDFIDACPNISIDNAESMFSGYTFSLPFFMFSTDELNHFRKLYLTPIRKEIIETGIYPEARGIIKKKNTVRAERDKFIIKEYKSIDRKNPFPIGEIKKRLIRKVSKDFKYGSAEYKEYNCTEITIRRVLQRYTNK